jgi:alkanesulfonate monooxygenase SsuD/methylene tetrahydromethanopterin reductase-like flavin-dependent oxidoreductase (luciferase family)
MIHVGYLACTQDPPSGANMTRVIDETIAEAQVAEASGWDSCFISEHHQQADGYLPNPLLMAGLIGMRTQRLTVGTSVLLLPLYQPVHVAEDCAVIDLATQGRLILGVGVGYQEPDFAAFEVPIAERATRTEEALAILRHCWSGQRFSFSGTHFHYHDALITPVPFQRPGPPVWMAAASPAGLRRAARLADGWLADPIQSLPIVKSNASRYRAAAVQAGRPPFICLMCDAVIANSMPEAEAASGPTMYMHRFYFQYGAYVPDEYLQDVTRPEELSFAKAAKDRLIVGSADDCLAQLQRWQAEIQPDYLIIRFRQPGGPTHQRTLETIRVFGEQVIPKL